MASAFISPREDDAIREQSRAPVPRPLRSAGRAGEALEHVPDTAPVRRHNLGATHALRQAGVAAAAPMPHEEALAERVVGEREAGDAGVAVVRVLGRPRLRAMASLVAVQMI